MDLRQIQYFLSLFEEQSVTRAARRLNIVQPALSMQIAKLERDIGKQLFTRTPRRMIPTPAAEEMYRLFMPFMSEFNRAKDRIMHQGDSLTGHVRVGMVPSIGQHVLPEVLEKFVARHPNVTLSIAEGLTDLMIEAVARGQLDLSYTNRSDRFPAVTMETVLAERILFVTGVNDVTFAQRVRLSDITGQRFVLPTRENGLRKIFDAALKTEDVHLVPAVEVDSIMSTALLLEKSLYVSFLPESIVRNLRVRYGLRFRSYIVMNEAFTRQIVCSHNPRRPLGKAALAFHQMLSETIAGEKDREDRVPAEEKSPV